MALKPLGPLGDVDAKFIQAVIEMTSPLVLLEFGHLFGDSARSMLEVMRPDARLYSYDCDQNSHITDSRFTFFKQSQTEVSGIENIDFVFLDASHDLELNKITFEKIKDKLSPNAIIAIHDTGTWPSNVYGFDRGYNLPDGRYIHCPGERLFSNWLTEAHSEYKQVHLHSNRDVRHGITLVQKSEKLAM